MKEYAYNRLALASKRDSNTEILEGAWHTLEDQGDGEKNDEIFFVGE